MHFVDFLVTLALPFTALTIVKVLSYSAKRFVDNFFYVKKKKSADGRTETLYGYNQKKVPPSREEDDTH